MLPHRRYDEFELAGPGERELSTTILQYITNLAHTGNPNARGKLNCSTSRCDHHEGAWQLSAGVCGVCMRLILGSGIVRACVRVWLAVAWRQELAMISVREAMDVFVEYYCRIHRMKYQFRYKLTRLPNFHRRSFDDPLGGPYGCDAARSPMSQMQSIPPHQPLWTHSITNVRSQRQHDNF